MPVYRGNLGNLLQHSVLCDIMAATRQHATRLDFVDAHSMAPFADERPKRDATAPLFDCVQHRLPGERTPYELAWNTLASSGTAYPNSASFVASIWSGPASLILCESDPTTARELRLWAADVKLRQPSVAVEVAEGDWRDRFRRGLGLSGDLALFSFDPYMFDRHGLGRNPGHMYPGDLDVFTQAITELNQGVIVQLSTYSANNNNPQDAVIQALKSRLEFSGLEIVAVVRADGNMMSVLLARNVDWQASLNSIPARFQSWLAQARTACAVHGISSSG